MFSRDGQPERDLSWFDGSNLRDISADGEQVLLTEAAVAGGPRYRSYLRNTDGSPAIMLGEGQAWAISSDKKFVIFATAQRTENTLSIVPTGPGVTTKLPPGDIASFGFAFFSAGGRQVIFSGRSGTTGWRVHTQDITGAAAPVGLGPHIAADEFYLSPDATRVAARLADGTNRSISIPDGTVQRIPGIDDEDEVTFVGFGRTVRQQGQCATARDIPRKFFDGRANAVEGPALTRHCRIGANRLSNCDAHKPLRIRLLPPAVRSRDGDAEIGIAISYLQHGPGAESNLCIAGLRRRQHLGLRGVP